KSILDVSAAQTGVSVKPAVLSTETRGFIDVRGTQHKIHAVGVARQCSAVERVANGRSQAGVGQVSCGVHKSVATKRYVAAYVTGRIAVGGRDMLNGCATE